MKLDFVTPMRPFFIAVVIATLGQAGVAPDAAPFNKNVASILRGRCAMCHNEAVTSGGMNIAAFLAPSSIEASREGWERIFAKLRTGEMPPKGAPPVPPEQLQTILNAVQSEFDRVDRTVKPDPGRVTARRLNRAEYANTIRDLLGVHFAAGEEFPPDDSGYGFDNIGDVLTVSPVLMQKYLSAAEAIASRAIGGDPLPKPGVFNKRAKVRRKDVGTIELRDSVEFPAEYIVRVLITGHRGPKDKPVNLLLSVDGKPMKTAAVAVTISDVNRQGGATQRTSEEVRAYLEEGPHSFRAEFVNDDFAKTLTGGGLNSNQNIYPETFEIEGPFPSKEETASRKRLLICNPGAGVSCIERILTPLAHAAYRRPVKKAEVAELVKIAERARASGYTPDQSVQFAIAAMLVSPQFLFRVERDPKPGLVARISDVELATRLSYFLWSSAPDGELLRLAESGKLHQPEVLDAQIKRMVADSKSSALAENFAGQWLETRSLDAVKPDPKKFPDWGPDLKDAMRAETRLFFEEVMRENRPISDFIDGKYSYLNELLAKHYGIAGVTGSDLRRVELGTEERSGILTQASVLTVSSYPSRTSPVLRGKYILENILGGAPPPPPPDVPALDEDAVGKKGTLRQQFEAHRAGAVCASCHARMDVLGFGLENYDAIGRWRTKDGTFPVDASGNFPNGKAFTTPAQMKDLLRSELPEFTRCLTEKMLTYALGRGVERFDRRAVQAIAAETAESGYRFQTLMTGIAHSLPFQSRRGLSINISTPLAQSRGSASREMAKQ